MKVALRSRGRRLALFSIVSALTLLTVVAHATAATTSVQFSRSTYVAPLGQALPDPISVTVKDELGDPVSGVEVAFSVTPESNGATASISALTATTDGAGVAQITGTAGAQAGYPGVHATVDGVSAHAVIVNRPPGYRPGEQLASIVAQNQDGVTEDVRDGLAKKAYLLVDVCAGWCGPCQMFAQETQDAITQLATIYGVRLKLATVLLEGVNGGTPSDQSDAQHWKSSNGLTDSVFHAGGSFSSPLARAAGFFLYDNDPFIPAGAFPTHLLVDPDGNILDRLVGATFADQTVDRVLAHVNKTKNKKPPKPPEVFPVGEVGVQLPNGETHSDLFNGFDFHNFEWGDVALFGEDVNGIAQRTWYYLTPGSAPLAASGTLTTSLTRVDKTEAKQPLTSSSLEVNGIMLLEGEFVGASTTLPAVQNGGTVTVAADLAALRAAMRAKLGAGDFFSFAEEPTLLPPLTPEQIDALVDSLLGIQVIAEYTISTKK